MTSPLPVLEWDTLRCPECGQYMAEPAIVGHCVRQHPESVIARMVALALLDGVALGLHEGEERA